MYQRADGASVRCLLCPHNCLIHPDRAGKCLARLNKGGVLTAKSYARASSLALDPIEKKPLYHFHPGTHILSVGSYGCNLFCDFCQNWEISNREVPTAYLPPEHLAKLSFDAGPDNIGVAFTYNEPFVGFEYLMDCAKLLKKQGQYAVLVTNGMINKDPLLELAPLIDAANIDLKCFSPDLYQKLGGDLETVKQTIELSSQRFHVEVTTLIVPGLNDNPGHIEEIARWLAAVNPEIPYHVSRFFPKHKMSGAQLTPVEKVYGFADIARNYLHNVYTGNC